MKKTLWILILFCVSVLPNTAHAATVASRVAGRIVLDVHRHGEAWYIDPVQQTRVYLGQATDALRVMQEYGLGITNANLATIPTYGEPGGGVLAARLAGRIVLAVESKGEAWYIDPVTLTRVSLGTPQEAWQAMRNLGLGITSVDLVSIPVANDVNVRFEVPFFSQAPLGDWSDRRQGEGCEEAAVLMAVSYARGENLSPIQARDKIIAMSDWELAEFGYFVDTSIADTHSRLLTDYLNYTDTELKVGITVDDIRDSLTQGDLVIVPVSGVLVNRSYIGRAPVRHTVLVVGYEAATDTFLVHDPATTNPFTRISAIHLQSALMDYASGDHVPIGTEPDAMITLTLP